MAINVIWLEKSHPVDLLNRLLFLLLLIQTCAGSFLLSSHLYLPLVIDHSYQVVWTLIGKEEGNAICHQGNMPQQTLLLFA